MLDIRENEHQELLYSGVDLTQPVAIHIPSPLGPLGYYLFVRVPADVVGQLNGVSARVDLIGLHETHTSMAPGQGAVTPAVISSTQPGMVWYCLGKAMLARGGGEMVLTGWPAAVTQADLLLCTWPRFLTSGMAEEWIAVQADPLWAASGVPLGGIGGGRVDICRDGRFRNFSMNNSQDAPLEYPNGLAGAYLAVACDGVVKDLASRPIVTGHEACPQLAYDPRFPQATLTAPDIFPGVTAKVTLTGTLCPQDLRRSSIPGFLLRWEVTNSGETDRVVRCQMGWPNLVGIGGGVAGYESGIGYGDGFYRYWDDPTGRAESRVDTAQYSAIRYTGTPAAEFLASAGEHLLAVVKQDGMTTEITCGEGTGEAGAELIIPAGGTVTATMVLVTAMPHWVDSLGVDRGRYWQRYFGDGDALLAALVNEADELLAETGALAALLADSTLPGWLTRRLSNCNYPLITNSVLYQDGRYSINEGPTEMAGCYGTIDQRLAAHPATQLFFPQLNVTELSEFATIQGVNGGISHDLGGGHLEREPNETTWPDLTCSFIIQCARHAWSTGDATFAEAMWPRMRRALYRHGAWADAGDGVAQLGELGTSYDSYHYIGTTAYMGTLWLAALAICEKWARERDDQTLLADIARWRPAAINRIETDLWNGRYYIAYGNTAGVRRETCHAGQLAGQVYARLLCGVDVLDEQRLASVVDALLSLNGSERFAIPPDEVSGDGQAGSDYGWVPYVEGFMMTAVAGQNDPRLWPLWERIVDAVERNGAHPCDTRLMYRPVTGEQNWGTYYMTAPASWLVYDAWLDFFYAPQPGLLRLRPTTPGRYPIVHPLFWATLEVAESGAVTLTVQRTFSDTPITLAALEMRGETGSIEIAGTTITSEAGEGRYQRYALPQPVVLQAGVSVEWRQTADVLVK